jgi:hypothetical protein
LFSYKYENLDELYKEIENISTEVTSNNNILRISLESVYYKDKKAIFKFLNSIKYLLRGSLSVCIFSISKDVYEKSDIMRFEYLSDFVIEMNSFTGNDVENTFFTDYTGFFNLKKLLKINSLNFNFNPDTLNYTFNLKKRKFYIERFVLPPEESREDNKDRPKFIEKSKNSISLKDIEF